VVSLSPQTRRSARQVLVAVVGAVLLVLGVAVLLRADAGLVRERTVVAGVPVTVLRPADDGPVPAVVVVHGFSASGRLMDGIALALARDGWLVAVPDLDGHGANLRGLSAGGDDGIDQNLQAVSRWLQTRVEVDGAAALVGHSMGAGVVTRTATADPQVPATVALSLPSADDLPPAASGPSALLLLVGSAEPARFGETARQAAALGYETATISGAEHISILFRPETLQRTVDWLDAAAGRTGAGAVAADRRLLAVAAAYVGSALLFWPMSAWVLRPSEPRVRGRTRWWPAWLLVPLLAVAAGLVLWVAPVLGQVVPLLVGGYLAAAMALTGLAAWAVSARVEPVATRPVLGGLGLGLYAAVTVAVPAQLGWAEVSLAGPRAWSALALVVAFGLYAYGEGLLAWRGTLGYGRMVTGRLLLAAVLVALAVTGVAPGFLLLLAPVMVVVLPWFGAYAVRVTRLSGSVLAGAIAQALPLALLVGIATPLA
jgi:dienelactone hydrolase